MKIDLIDELRWTKILPTADNFGKTPLFEAIKNGHAGASTLLEEAGAELYVEDPGICLCEVVARKELDFLTRLLANGMNPNSKNYNLQTPLHLAAAEGLYQASASLLQSGASVFATDRYTLHLVSHHRHTTSYVTCVVFALMLRLMFRCAMVQMGSKSVRRGTSRGRSQASSVARGCQACSDV